MNNLSFYFYFYYWWVGVETFNITCWCSHIGWVDVLVGLSFRHGWLDQLHVSCQSPDCTGCSSRGQWFDRKNECTLEFLLATCLITHLVFSNISRFGIFVSVLKLHHKGCNCSKQLWRRQALKILMAAHMIYLLKHGTMLLLLCRCQILSNQIARFLTLWRICQYGGARRNSCKRTRLICTGLDKIAANEKTSCFIRNGETSTKLTTSCIHFLLFQNAWQVPSILIYLPLFHSTTNFFLIWLSGRKTRSEPSLREMLPCLRLRNLEVLQQALSSQHRLCI